MNAQSLRNKPAVVALTYVLVAGLWIVFSGYVVEYLVPDAQWRAQLEVGKGLLFVLVTAALLYLLLRNSTRIPPSVTASDTEVSSPPRWIYWVLLALVALVPLAGFTALSIYRPVLEQQVIRDLASIADLKRSRIELWRNERLRDMRSLSESPLLAQQIRNYLDGGDPLTDAAIRDRLDSVRIAYGYLDAALLDSNGRVLLHVGDTPEFGSVSSPLREIAAQRRVPVHSSIGRSSDEQFHIDFIAPIENPDGGSDLLGYVMYSIDPLFQMLDMLGRWPTDSASGEALLVNRQSGEVLYIVRRGESLEADASVLSTRTANGDLTVSMRLVGGEAESAAGVDYRGQRVLAVIHDIESTDWAVIAKVDEAEAMEPLLRMAAWVSGVVLISVAAIGVMLFMFWQQQRQRYLAAISNRQQRHRQQLRRQEQVYRGMFINNPYPMWIYDPCSLKFLAVNNAALKQYGYSREEFLARTAADIRPAEDLPRFHRYLEQIQEDQIVGGELWRHCLADGTAIDVETFSYGLHFEDHEARLVLALNVSDRVRAERDLAASQRFTRATLDALPIQIAVLDDEGVIVATNRAWEQVSLDGCAASRRLSIGANYLEHLSASARGDDDARQICAGLREILEARQTDFQHEYRCRTGDEDLWFHMQATAFPPNGALRVVVAHEEVTAGKLAELELQKLNRYYAALSAMNGSIVRATDPDLLRQEVCRIAAESGELELVFIGVVDEEHKILTPVAAYGRATGYLDVEEINVDSQRPEGRRPAGQALQTGRTVVVDNILNEEEAGPWQEAASRWNLRSKAVCPLPRKHGPSGVIAFYSDQIDYFTPELIRLLEELASDLVFGLDTLEIQRLQREAQEQLLINARVIESTQEGIFITDHEHRIRMVNRALCKIVGYSESEILGELPSTILEQNAVGEARYREVVAHLESEGDWQGELLCQHRSGRQFPAWASITRVEDVTGAPVRHITIFRDISEHKQQEERIRHFSTHDLLTDLPNRAVLDDRITHALLRASRTGEGVAVMFINLDRFKLINDTLGRDVGDQLLQIAAERITRQLRRSDTVCRVGGDEFIVLLEDFDNSSDVAGVAQKILRSLAAPCEVGGHELIVTASIGIALCPENDTSRNGLSKKAELAMTLAKQSGQNRLEFYSAEMGATATEYLELQNDLRGAIARGELSIAYQPQIELGSRALVGTEALLRWHHPKRGLVSPAKFVPIAEASGIILEIGAWVLRQACSQLREWRERGVIDVPVSVNISALQFRQPDFVHSVFGILEEVGLPSEYLELEVTESLLMSSEERALKKLRELHYGKVKLAIDDFGTGYSSLSYLRQFPANLLKIDKSFVQDLPEDKNAAAIATSIVGLGRSLGMRVIAEGVETVEQEQFLRQIGCDEAQGYLYAPPLFDEEFEKWLASGSPR